MNAVGNVEIFLQAAVWGKREANYVKVAEMLIAAGAKVHPWMLGLGTVALEKIVARQLAV